MRFRVGLECLKLVDRGRCTRQTGKRGKLRSRERPTARKER